MWPQQQQLKLNEEKVKTYWFGSAKWFWAPTIFHEMMLRLLKHPTKP
jgi:hypothetical protein